MEYKEIVSVTGLQGLYQMVSSKSSGAVIRSLTDKTTQFASSRIHNFTPLESIEVFTHTDTVNLSEVFRRMQEKEGELAPLDPTSDPKEIRGYFEQVFPGLDEEKVHGSDLKKMLKWYAILKSNELLSFPAPATTSEPEPQPSGEAVASAEPAKTKKPSKPAPARKAKK